MAGDLFMIATLPTLEGVNASKVSLVCTRAELDRLKPYASESNESELPSTSFENVRLTKRQLLLAMSPQGAAPSC